MLAINLETMENKIKDVESLGFTRNEVINMIKKFPGLFSLSQENRQSKINDLIELGYTNIEVKNMLKIMPSLFSLTIDNIKQKIYDVINLGYTKEEVIDMTVEFPQALTLSIENLKPKIEFFNSIGLHDLIIVSPIRLIQSISLSYARYNFLNDNGIEVNMENYRILFLGKSAFEKL